MSLVPTSIVLMKPDCDTAMTLVTVDHKKFSFAKVSFWRVSQAYNINFLCTAGDVINVLFFLFFDCIAGACHLLKSIHTTKCGLQLYPAVPSQWRPASYFLYDISLPRAFNAVGQANVLSLTDS